MPDGEDSIMPPAAASSLSILHAAAIFIFYRPRESHVQPCCPDVRLRHLPAFLFISFIDFHLHLSAQHAFCRAIVVRAA